ncbi:ABC transporter ATP-binding protein [Rubritalea spongiae]|uniref:ABC transporter ATP-binding protein n=1 Tax=Rubritalea spongiae TaxID=430797 RepID=A0ABW5DWZ3_9BACT
MSSTLTDSVEEKSTAKSPSVEVHDLRIDYGSHLAVDGMNLEIPVGTIYGLVGPNGAGKTSTFKALASLLTPTHGHIILNGYNIATHQRLALANIGYMPDMAPVASDLKVWEFLEMFAGAHGLSGKMKTERIRECLEQVDLLSEKNAMCTALSRGMMQRLVLAKTLLHKPQLLILDEPASGMDIKSRVKLRNVLRGICRQGSTVLISSHILPELTEMCDMIGVLHKGKLLDSGNVDEVLHRMTGLLPEIRIRLAEAPSQNWIRFLDSNPKVSSVQGQDILNYSFHFDGNSCELSLFIHDMISQGYLVSRIAEQQRSLEEILLDLEYDGH